MELCSHLMIKSTGLLSIYSGHVPTRRVGGPLFRLRANLPTLLFLIDFAPMFHSDREKAVKTLLGTYTSESWVIYLPVAFPLGQVCNYGEANC